MRRRFRFYVHVWCSFTVTVYIFVQRLSAIMATKSDGNGFVKVKEYLQTSFRFFQTHEPLFFVGGRRYA